MSPSSVLEDACWEVIHAYFNQGGGADATHVLVQHQIESYNEFIDKKLNQIIHGFNPIAICHHYRKDVQDFMYKIHLNIHNPCLSKPVFQTQDGTHLPMTPHIARMNNLTYASQLTVDIAITTETINEDNVIEKKETVVHKVNIGKIPIMVRSKICMLNQLPAVGEGDGRNECRYDPGGYFIINGNEKVVVSQDRISENKTLVFAPNVSSGDGLTAEIRSMPDGLFLPPKICSIHLSGKPNHLGRVIKLNATFLKTEVPLFVLFRALGVVADREILQHIVLDIHDPKNHRLISELKACADDASDVLTQEDALAVLQRILSMSGFPREYLDQPAAVSKFLHQTLRNDFLSHTGTSYRRKALYLGYMVRKLLRCHLGYEPYDNRDSYIYKRIDSPGVLLSVLFRQCYGKLIKESRNLIQRELHLWRAATRLELAQIIHPSNIHRFLKPNIIDSCFRYALSTGNWVVKTLGSFQNNRQGVAQVLNRMAYLSTLSHLRRINTPMEKNGKLVQPRKLENTQYGMICPAETPEGGSVGLVKNMALSTRITTNGSSAYIRDLLPGMGVEIYSDALTAGEAEAYMARLADKGSVLVQVNGDLVGFHREPTGFYRAMKRMKRLGEISPFTAVYWDIPANTIVLNTEAGRMCRPMLIVEDDGQLRLAKLRATMTDAEWAAFVAQPFQRFVVGTEHDRDVEGFIEFLDVEEIDKGMIAMRPADLAKPVASGLTAVPPRYTHCELHPSLMNGVLAVNIPFSDHNQSPRNAYQCLWEEEPVMMADGSRKKIKDVRPGDEVITFDPETMHTFPTKVVHQYTRETDKNIVKVRTETGREIITTDDHKYWTNEGWKCPRDFTEHTKVGIIQENKYTFDDVDDNITCILTEEDFINKLSVLNVKDSLISKHLKICKNAGLIPLYSNNIKLQKIAAISGYILSDGSLNVYTKNHGGNTPQAQACFGTYDDAYSFEKDIESIGFNMVLPRKGTRTHPSGVIHTTYDVCHNGAFPSLLLSLDISYGKKTETYRKPVPKWIIDGSVNIQKAFCSGFQGGDGCMIRWNKMYKRDYNFVCAQTSQQIHPQHVESLNIFMGQIVNMLTDIGIEVKLLKPIEVKPERMLVAYKISDKHANLIKYFDKVGYTYDSHKYDSSMVVVEYLKWKKEIQNKKYMAIEDIRNMIKGGMSNYEIKSKTNLPASKINDIKRSLLNNRSIGASNLYEATIENWKQKIKIQNHIVFQPVSVEPMPNCRIADITVESETHCFFGGDGFAVHNSAMGKQAVGIYMSNYNQRIDTLGHILNYPQKPLARTRLSKITHSENLPSGVNAVVAIMTYTGFNQEDSVMINKSALDRGLFSSTYYKSYRDQCNKNHSTGEEEVFMRPDAKTTAHLKPYNYGKVADDGFVPKDTYVDSGDILIGKVMPQKIQGVIYPKDASLTMKANDSGHIDMNFQGTNGDGYKFCKVRLRKYRKPTVGDKVSSRHGQKGTIGMVYNQQDMPFSRDGITPDIIINPHAVPSRMTIGQILECVMGKAACCLGTLGDATPFNKCSVEDIATVLESYGMERHGNEILYDGRTGCQIRTEIFMGPTFYQRLKHMVEDKMHTRGGNGPVVMLTRQPAEGRARNGGLRFGEMERDAIVAHGASAFLKERMLDVSDNYRVFVCRKCGIPSVANPERNIYKCTYCKNNADITQVRIPYSMKLLMQELMSMAIAPRMVI